MIMTLKPLGLKDSLIQPTSLGNDFKLQRSLSPLCQSLNPLGQSLQPFGNSVLQPLGEVNKDGESGNWRLDAGTQIREEGENFAGGIPQFFDNQLPIRTRPEISSNLGEIPDTQDFVGNFPTNYRSKNEPLSPNAAALNSPNAARENIAQLKPLAISKPLVQASISELSSLSGLPQFTQRQSTSSSENLVSTSGETSSLSNSMPTSTVDISNNVSPIVSAKPANNISSSDSLDLPQISRFNDTFLGFNNQLSSQFITKRLPQPQTSFSSKLSLDRESLPSSSATNMGEVNAIAPTSPNLIQSKFSSVPPQETISLQPETRAPKTEDLTAKADGQMDALASTSQAETRAAKTEDLTAKADGQVDALGSTSSNLIQAQANSVSSQKPRSLQLESIGKHTENLTNKTEVERDAMAPASPNLIQAKPSPGSSQETVASQREIDREQPKNLTAKTEGEVETAPISNNLIQSKPSPVPIQETESLTAKTGQEVEAAPSSANLIQSKPSPVPIQETESLTAKTEGEVDTAPTSNNLIQSKPSPIPIQETEGLTAKTEVEVEAAPISANLIQSKPSPVPTQETEGLTAKTEGEVDAVSSSANLIQSKPSPVPTQETESLTSRTEGEVEVAPSSANLIQSKPSPVPIQETESLTAKTGQEVEAAPSSANLIQSKPSPVPIQETESLTAKTEGEVDAAPTSLNLIQSKISPLPTQKTEGLTARNNGEVDVAPISPNLIQSKPSPVPNQEAESLTAKTDGEVDVAPISPNLIQAKSLPSSSIKNISPPLENFRENKEDLSVISPKASSEISSDTISSSQTNIVQARSDSPNFYPVQPLGNSKFLAQSSDLFLSDFVTNATDKQPTTSQETSLLSSGSPPNISNLSEEDFPNISRTTDTESPNISAKVENIPNSWLSISELLGENTNNAPANIDSVKPLGFSQRLNNPNNSMLAQLENKYTNNNEPKNNTFDTPTSWSNISELLGETSTTTPDSIPIENEIPPASLPEPESSPSYTFASPNVSDNSTSTTSGETSKLITVDILGKDRAVDDEELEKLAQKVYTLMRQWLEIEQERQGYQSLGYPTWLSNITSTYGTSAKVRSAPERSTPGSPPTGDSGEVSPVDDKLQKLTGEIYYLVRQRLEINRERYGGYYSTRLY